LGSNSTTTTTDLTGAHRPVFAVPVGLAGTVRAHLDHLRAEKASLARPEHTALDERLGTLQAVRVTIVALVVLAAAVVPRQLGMNVDRVLPFSIAYLVVSFGGQLVDNAPAVRAEFMSVIRSIMTRADSWSAGRAGVARRSGAPFQQMLLPVDSAYLAVLTVPSGGAQSDFLLLFAVQLISVTLLASPRTGMRLALWDSALLIAISVLQLGGELGQLLGTAHVVVPTVGAVAVRITLLWAVAASTGFFSALSERELRRSKAQLDSLTQMASDMELAMEAGDDAGAMAGILLRSVLVPFSLRRAAVVWERKGELAAATFTTGDTSADQHRLLAGVAAPFDGEVARRALSGNRPTLVRSIAGHSDGTLDTLLPGAVNVIVVPLRAGRERLGLLLAEAGPPLSRRVGRRSLDMLSRFATHASLTLSNADLKAEIARLAFFDSLTGLANRRELTLGLAREVARSVRTAEPLSVAIIDIDHFKVINDTYGHMAGDDVLREVAQAILSSVRDVDLVARYGGEEFAVVLPNCGTDGAVVVLERVRAAVARVGERAVTEVRVSAGIATETGTGCDGDRLIARADEALYQSKRNGRDRVTAAGPVPAVVPAGPAPGGGPDRPAGGTDALSAGVTDALSAGGAASDHQAL
jgi:diguanylate cyclase (GGDEF)-like protein